MPLIYSVSGRIEPFSESDERVHAIRPAVEAEIAREMARELDGDPFLNQFHPDRTPRSQAQTAYREVAAVEAGPKALTAADLMTSKVQTLQLASALKAAVTVMKNNGFRHLPVVSADGKLQGIVSERDLLRASNHGALDRGEETDPIQKIMTASVLTATPNTSIREIAEVMLKRRIGALPIVSDTGLVVGILTTSDILRAIVERGSIDLRA